MNNLQVFNYTDKQVRTVTKDGEPWFVARDVCVILEIGNITDAMARLDEDEFDRIEVTDSLNRQQMANVINEAGLYSLVLGSRKPEAKQFKRWITHEVIPSIRKTGQYSLNLSKLSPELQAVSHLLNAAAKLEEKVDKLETTQQAIKEAVISEPDNWREDIRHKLNNIAQHIGNDKYREVRAESYKLLERRAGVLLERRLDNLKARLLKEGVSKSKIDKTGKIDVIDQDKKLREIYSKIVSEYLIKYVA